MAEVTLVRSGISPSSQRIERRRHKDVLAAPEFRHFRSFKKSKIQIPHPAHTPDVLRSQHGRFHTPRSVREISTESSGIANSTRHIYRDTHADGCGVDPVEQFAATRIERRTKLKTEYTVDTHVVVPRHYSIGTNPSDTPRSAMNQGLVSAESQRPEGAIAERQNDVCQRVGMSSQDRRCRKESIAAVVPLSGENKNTRSFRPRAELGPIAQEGFTEPLSGEAHGRPLGAGIIPEPGPFEGLRFRDRKYGMADGSKAHRSHVNAVGKCRAHAAPPGTTPAP